MKIIKIFFFILSVNLIYSFSLANSKDITFKGLSRLSLDDISTLSSVDISKKSFSEVEINQIIKDLYSSDQILNINLNESNDFFTITIEESLIIENIYINGNVFLKDDDLLKFLESKINFFINKDSLDTDLKTIKNIYLAQGFNEVSVNFSLEKFSESKINIIFQINEGNKYKIKNINFYGNKTYNSKFLASLINSKSINFYNIFSNGSNLNKGIFENDRSLISDFYKKQGFQEIKVSYILQKSFLNSYNLNFYIEENIRSKVSSVSFNISDDLISNNNFTFLTNDFERKLKKNDNYFDYDLINSFIDSSNKLIKNYNLNKELSYDLIIGDNEFKLVFNEISANPKIINDISIYGNSITKNNVLQSKIDFGPGDYYSEYKINSTREKLEKLKYVNKTNVITDENDGLVNISYEIDENKKTGNFGFGVAFNGDTGGGIVLNLKDTNILGSGNEIDSDFNINSEVIKFDFSFTHHPLNNSNYSNRYTLRNKESDFQNSFGYKLTEQSFGYEILFDYSNSISASVGFSISNQVGHSGLNSSDNEITDNIGDFTDSIFKISLSQDKTNNFLYPNDGFKNNFSILYSPDTLSDNAFIKATYENDLYFKLKKSDNYFFLANNIGVVESLNNKRLKTINSFSLGGLNFKGYDFRGIGPKNSNNIYLGGNKYFTSTIGYGTSFIFDKKDNMYLRYFYSLGSIWDNDYTSSSFKIRSSAGISFDLLSPIGPISFTYAVPIEKEVSDSVRNFNFSIGTAF